MKVIYLLTLVSASVDPTFKMVTSMYSCVSTAEYVAALSSIPAED